MFFIFNTKDVADILLHDNYLKLNFMSLIFTLNVVIIVNREMIWIGSIFVKQAFDIQFDIQPMMPA